MTNKEKLFLPLLLLLISTPLCMGGGERKRPIADLLTCTGAIMDAAGRTHTQDLTPHAIANRPYTAHMLHNGPVCAVVATTGKGLTLASVMESKTSNPLDTSTNGEIARYIEQALIDKQDSVQKLAYKQCILKWPIRRIEHNKKDRSLFSHDTISRLQPPPTTDCLSMLLVHGIGYKAIPGQDETRSQYVGGPIYASNQNLTPVIAALFNLQKDVNPSYTRFLGDHPGILKKKDRQHHHIYHICTGIHESHMLFAGNEAFWNTLMTIKSLSRAAFASPNEHVKALCKVLHKFVTSASHARNDANIANQILAALRLQTPSSARKPICFIVMQRHNPSHPRYPQMLLAHAPSPAPPALDDSAVQESKRPDDAPGAAPRPRSPHQDDDDSANETSRAKRQRVDQNLRILAKLTGLPITK